MTLNHESLIATAQSMEQDGLVSATFQVSLVQQGGEEPGEGVTQENTVMVMPGEVGIFEAVVKIGFRKPPIVSSSWTLNGTMIDLEQAVQTPLFSRVPTTNGPIQRMGGKNGLSKGKIMTAWVGMPGIHEIVVTGTYMDGDLKPFVIKGTVVLLPAPVTAGDPEIVGQVGVYPYEERNTSIHQELGFDVSKAPNVGFQWKLRTGENLIGTSGFVQMIRSREYLRVGAGATTQRRGALIKDENILDGDGLNIFFPNASGGKPDADVKISDGPFQGMEGYIYDKGQPLDFFSYKCKETKRTYLAYQAIKGPVSIASFVVGASYQEWQWYGQAVRRDSGNPFEASGVEYASLGTATTSLAWMPLEWSANIRNDKYQKWGPK